MFKCHLLFIRNGSEEGSLLGIEIYPGWIYLSLLFKTFEFRRKNNRYNNKMR